MPRPAFTLLEMLAVLVVLGVVVGLVAPRAARSLDAGGARAQLRDLTQRLTMERVGAMETGEPREVEMVYDPVLRRLDLVSSGGDRRSWTGWRAPMLAESRDRPASRVTFGSTGRATGEDLRFVRDGDDPELAGSGWRVEFDRVTGRPRLLAGVSSGVLAGSTAEAESR